MTKIHATSDTKPLTEQEFFDIMYKISKPTFNFMIKRINKEILDNPDYKDLDLNDFFNIIIGSMSATDMNMIRWMQEFHKMKTNYTIDQNKLLMPFLNTLNKSLQVTVQ